MLAEYHQFAGLEWKQPVGVLDGLPDEYIDSPGSSKRKKKTRRTREREYLGKRLSEWTVDELVQMLSIDAWDVQEDAADALGQLGDPRALEPLLALARAKTSNASGTALYAAFKINPQRTADALLEAIATRAPLTFVAAAELAAKSGELRAIPLLTEVLRDPDPKAAQEAVSAGQALAAFGEAGVQALAQLLTAEEAHVRYRAADSLMYTNNPKAAELLATLINDPDPQVREIAGYRSDDP